MAWLPFELVKLLGLIIFAVGCSPTPYAYTFQITDPGAHAAETPRERDTVEDDTIKAELQIGSGSILLDLTNKTTDVLQVEWAKIVIDRGDGTKTRLRPSVDLGWIDPGAKATAQLVPFTLPHTGGNAAGYEGRTLELTVPMIARREPKTYHFHFTAHVHPL